MLQNVRSQIIADQIRVPDCTIQEALHAIRSAFSRVFRSLPAVFALRRTHDAFEECQRSPTRFGTHKTRGDTSMELGKFLSPLPHVGERRVCSFPNEGLRLLHHLLLSLKPSRRYFLIERAYRRSKEKRSGIRLDAGHQDGWERDVEGQALAVVRETCDNPSNQNKRSWSMSVVAIIPLSFFVLVFLWVGGRSVRNALSEIRTVARLQQSGVLQPGTILKIELKRYPPTMYGTVLFQYKENRTTYRGKHFMSAPSAKSLMKGDQEVMIRFLPGLPRSARIDEVFTDPFEIKRTLIMGSALCGFFVVMMGAAIWGLVLGWTTEAVVGSVVLAFFLWSLLSLPVAWLALRFLPS